MRKPFLCELENEVYNKKNRDRATDSKNISHKK